MRIRVSVLAALVALLALLLAACGGDDSSGKATDRGDKPAAAAGDGPCAGDTDDLLAQVCDKGTLTVSTDPAYPPQSSLNEQTGEYEGFDIDVATEIAKRLGVDVAWETPAWDVITAGSWNGRWDMTRRLDDADQRPAEGPLLHRALQLHAGRGGRRRRQQRRQRPQHRPRRQEDRRLQRLHLRAVPRRRTSRSTATPSTSSSTTPRSPATTPTPPRCRTCTNGRARRGDHLA